MPDRWTSIEDREVEAVASEEVPSRKAGLAATDNQDLMIEFLAHGPNSCTIRRWTG